MPYLSVYAAVITRPDGTLAFLDDTFSEANPGFHSSAVWFEFGSIPITDASGDAIFTLGEEAFVPNQTSGLGLYYQGKSVVNGITIPIFSEGASASYNFAMVPLGVSPSEAINAETVLSISNTNPYAFGSESGLSYFVDSMSGLIQPYNLLGQPTSLNAEGAPPLEIYDTDGVFTVGEALATPLGNLFYQGITNVGGTAYPVFGSPNLVSDPTGENPIATYLTLYPSGQPAPAVADFQYAFVSRTDFNLDGTTPAPTFDPFMATHFVASVDPVANPDPVNNPDGLTNSGNTALETSLEIGITPARVYFPAATTFKEVGSVTVNGVVGKSYEVVLPGATEADPPVFTGHFHFFDEDPGSINPYHTFDIQTHPNLVSLSLSLISADIYEYYQISGSGDLLIEASLLCFAKDTMITTPGGPTRVQDLQIGHSVTTREGHCAPVRWIGRQTVSTRFGPAERLMPVRFAAGSLGDGLPHADLTVTADHGMFVDGVICNAAALVNGTTITRVPLAEMGDTYTVYHIETEEHEIILANGAPAETFIDNVSRRVFDNYAEFEALYGDVPEMEELPYPRAMSARQVPTSIKAKLATQKAA